MAAEPAQPHPRYIAAWAPPDGSLSTRVEIYAGDDENAAIVAAAGYDAPAAGTVEITHHTAAGTLIGRRIVEHNEAGAEITDSFLDPEDEDATTRDLNAAADALEQTVDADEIEAAAERAQEAQADAHQRGELFDAAEYTSEELALPQVDGHGIDKIRVAFAGSIMLDRSNPDHVALFRKLELGKDVELRVAGDVTNVSTGWTTGKDGDLDAIVGERKIKVSTVYMLTAEEL